MTIMPDTSSWLHGDISDAELRACGLRPEDCIDFAVNVDPRGPAPEVLLAFQRAAVHRYPDPHYRELRQALAERDGLDVEEIAVGPGTSSLLWTLVGDLARRVQPRALRVVLAEPTFAEYRAACANIGAEIIVVPRVAADGFSLDLNAVEHAIEGHRADLFILGQPHNPSGRTVPHAALMALTERHPRCEVILDEAFLRLSTQHLWSKQRPLAHVWRLRSLTKELGFPGLRVGYVAAEPQRIARLRHRQPPWEVGHPASEAARVGVQTPGLVESARTRMLEDAAALWQELREQGFPVLPSDTVFGMVEVGDASGVHRALRRSGILVRDCTSFGLPRWLRLCGRPPADRHRLLLALLSRPE